MYSHFSSVANHYASALSGKVVVHKVSGTSLNDPGLRVQVLSGIQDLSRFNVRSVLVSGAGPALDASLGTGRRNEATQLRVTRPSDIQHIRAAIQQIQLTFARDCDGLGIAHHVFPPSVTGATRRRDGHGETGAITGIDSAAITAVLAQGKLAIVPFGGVDASQRLLNVNADDVAARIAGVLGAQKLILYTNAPGILRLGRDGTLQKADFLDLDGLIRLMREQYPDGRFVVDGGMLPKLQAIFSALMCGVPQVHVVQADMLLQELLTRTGAGTLIEKDPVVQLDFPAGAHLLPHIIQLRAECSAAKTPSGTPFLRPLTDEELQRLLPTTLVLRQRGVPVGTAFFRALDQDPATAVLGGFAVGEDHQGSGYGHVLMRTLLDQVGAASFRQAIGITASLAMQGLFEKYGRISDEFPTVLSGARERYGLDQHLVKLYVFDLSPPS